VHFRSDGPGVGSSILRARPHNLGTIAAPDAKAAEAEAVKLFGLDEEQHKRLVIWKRD
jgi:hypothetical protein